MKSEGKVRVLVRSRKVPVGTIFHSQPVYSASGVLVGSKPSRFVLYGRSLDDDHRRTIEEAQKLASNLGLGLEVVDESRSGPLSRLLSRFARSGPWYPSIVVSPSPIMVPSDQSPAFSHGC
jgi:hypothetical protein